MTSVCIHAEGGGAGSNFGSNTPWAACDPSVGSCHTAIEEVIVTSSWRSESLQDKPVAVTVFTGSEIEEVNQRDIVDLTLDVPGVTVAKNEDYETDLLIRGMGNETYQNSRAAPSVAPHMDGEFITSTFSNQPDFDSERIEVLRGPQGTLYGRNSTAGTINIVAGQDYVLRGMTQGDGSSVSDGLDIEQDSGFYEGEWGGRDKRYGG